jgi:hypothetical protein
MDSSPGNPPTDTKQSPDIPTESQWMNALCSACRRISIPPLPRRFGLNWPGSNRLWTKGEVSFIKRDRFYG